MAVRRLRYVVHVLAAFLCVVATYACLTRRARQREAPQGTQIVRVTRGTIARSVVATGTIEPIATVEIKSKANGIIERLYVDVGASVEAGQILAELDRQMLEASMRQARATLRGAVSRRNGAAAELEKSRLEAAGPEVTFRQRALRRTQQLFDQQLIAATQMDDVQIAWEMAVQRQQLAQRQLGVAHANLADAVADVDQATAMVERAAEELRHATIRAPIRGTVLSCDVTIGSAVSSILNLGAAATRVVTIGNIDRVFLRGKLNEADIGTVAVGLPVSILVEAFPDRRFTGKVTRLAPMGAAQEGVTTFEIDASVDAPGRELRAQMTGHAEILLQEYRDVLLVPQAAIAYDDRQRPSVEMPAPSEPGGRRKVSITVGVSNGSLTHVQSGLQEGDVVIVAAPDARPGT
jgi:HlyD family secretion protein